MWPTKLHALTNPYDIKCFILFETAIKGSLGPPASCSCKLLQSYLIRTHKTQSQLEVHISYGTMATYHYV